MARRWRLAAVAAGGVCVAAAPAGAELIYATNGASVTRFDSASPATTTTVPVTGLQAGETLVGIDVRPANQLLYGVGSTSRVYTVNPTSGIATPVGGGGFFTLNGTAFGMDFNPVPDLIRHVSNTEQSLRLNPNDGTLTGTDNPLNPAGNVVAVAYDRNFPRGGSGVPTTLFGIDSASGMLVRIGGVDGVPSPNGGLVSNIGSLGLGTNLNENIGLDISGVSGIAFASITTGGVSRLYTVNLTTGAATLVGSIGTGTTPYLGLAAAGAPEPAGLGLLATGAALLLGRRRRVSSCEASA